MKIKTFIPALFLIFIFLIPVRAQENTMVELEAVLKEVPTSFKNIRGEVISSENGVEMYVSTLQHEKSDFAGIGVVKGVGAIYQISYSFENDPELLILTNYATLLSSLKNEGYIVESIEEEQYTGFKVLTKDNVKMMEIMVFDTGFDVLLHANE